MPLTIAAAPSSAHDVARWLLNRLDAAFWELDGLLDTAILRNYEGHEILLDVTRGKLTLTAQVNLANDDDVPLTSIREVRAVPSDPDDPALFDLLDVIRYRLAPAYGRQNVSQAVAVLSTPLLEARAGTVRVTENDLQRTATMTLGHGADRPEVFITGGPTGTAPSVSLLMRSVSLPVAQEIIRLKLNADGHDIPAPLIATPGTLRTIVAIAREEARPRAHLADSLTSAPVDHGDRPSAPLYTAPGLSVHLAHQGQEPCATAWIERASVETATAALYAYTRQS